jgi:hypothetical protein
MAVGGLIVSVAGPPQALKNTMTRIIERKYFTRTGYAPKIKNDRIILPDFVAKPQMNVGSEKKETHIFCASQGKDGN